ncbi:contractile injection system tape measure protein [Chitinophaga sp. sic0106]|uniref:contractile injection system tape measure protein n=1 Tax=Chitinophaga sp. sic0106 TaxID=2854785 RepID=UPI001C4783A7|nr:contractile injection system tape measure protein [Chitinophaga sp. sic0106]MBV7530823.1 hypothetical protein [Chitinophaga sp. sic0106]
MPRHLINKLEFELACNDEMLALNLRHNFSATLQEQVTAVLDRVCSRFAGDDVYLRIDKLELDLGAMTPFGFQEDFEKVLEYKLEEALRQRATVIAFGDHKPPGFYYDTSPLAILQYFLIHGRLPWFAAGEVNSAAELLQQVLREHSAGFSQWLNAGGVPAQVWWRLGWQMPVTLQEEVIASVPLMSQLLADTKEMLHRVILHLPENLITVTREWLQMQEARLLQVVLLHFPQLRKETQVKLIVQILQQLIITAKEDLPKPAQQQLLTHIQHVTGVTLSGIIFQGDEIAAAGNGASDLPYDEMLEQLPTGATADAEAEKVLVSTAGLALLSPFLTRFFTVLNYWDTEKKEWVSNAARFKAIYLLHYLATGETAAPEYALSLEKVICGLPLAAPVPADLSLEEAEKKEADDLLLAVIGHWPMLKNTTIAGLRGSYLLREGLLAWKDKGWQLQVERKTLDVLLDGIPWGYNTLTFPWNKYLILVEW